MIKRSLIVASLLVAGTNALAFDSNKLYLGVGTSNGSGTYTAEGVRTVTADYDSSSIPIKIGYIFRNDDRIEISYESMEHNYNNGGGTNTISGWNIDWDLVFSNYKLGGIIAPYMTIGFGSYKVEDFTDTEELNGYAMNYGIGGLYKLNQHIEFEVSYRGKIIKWEDIEFTNSTVTSDSTGTAIYLGINYKF